MLCWPRGESNETFLRAQNLKYTWMGILKQVMERLDVQGNPMVPAWSFDAKSPILSSPLVFGPQNKVAIGTKDGRIICLSAQGDKLWEFSTQQKMSKIDRMFVDESSAKNISSSPAYHPDERLILVGTESGVLFALSEDGKPAWQFKAKGAIRGTPLVVDINNNDDLEILFTSVDRLLYVLSAKGRLVWTFASDAPIEAGPSYYKSANGNGIVFGTNAGTLYSVTTEGKERWNFKVKGPITAASACGKVLGTGDVYIVFGAHDNRLHMVSDRGLEEWSFLSKDKVLGSPTISDVNDDSRLEIFFGSTDDTLYALSAHGGEMWHFETNFWVATKPVIADLNNDGKQEIVVGSYDKTVYVLSAEGEYILESMPGSSNLTSDLQNVSGLINAPTGHYESKLLASYKAKGMITGISLHEQAGLLVVTANGLIEALRL